jgi:hypothetical protein
MTTVTSLIAPILQLVAWLHSTCFQHRRKKGVSHQILTHLPRAPSPVQLRPRRERSGFAVGRLRFTVHRQHALESVAKEFLGHAHELSGAHPEERVSRAIDNDKLRTTDAIVERLRVVKRDRVIFRRSDNQRETLDLG